jgi:hypothetical protein
MGTEYPALTAAVNLRGCEMGVMGGIFPILRMPPTLPISGNEFEGARHKIRYYPCP